MLTIKNFNKQHPIILNLTSVPGNTKITLTRTDSNLSSWASTKLVRKVGSAPSSSSDGTLVLTETTKNTYSSTGYEDTGLTNGTTYYYVAFSVDNEGNEYASNSVSETPQISLKSYGEIVAMSSSNAVIELNLYPTDYYNKFNSEGHIYYYSFMECLSDTGSTAHGFEGGNYVVGYSNGTWRRAKD